MQALIIIDAQNEFSALGRRPVPNFEEAVQTITRHAKNARQNNTPIAWVRHFNKPTESPAFVPNTWGAEFYQGLGPVATNNTEKEFHKTVYGAFTGSNLGAWLEAQSILEVLIVGFYTHGCVSTTSREAIMRDLTVYLDPAATGACNIEHEILGTITAEEVRRSALLQLANMGATIL